MHQDGWEAVVPSPLRLPTCFCGCPPPPQGKERNWRLRWSSSYKRRITADNNKRQEVDEITKDSNMDSNKKEEATLMEQEDEVVVDVQANVISTHLKGQVTVQTPRGKPMGHVMFTPSPEKAVNIQKRIAELETERGRGIVSEDGLTGSKEVTQMMPKLDAKIVLTKTKEKEKTSCRTVRDHSIRIRRKEGERGVTTKNK